MAYSPNSIETHIDTFLEQFKRSASKAKEKMPSDDFVNTVNRSQSAKFGKDVNNGEF